VQEDVDFTGERVLEGKWEGTRVSLIPVEIMSAGGGWAAFQKTLGHAGLFTMQKKKKDFWVMKEDLTSQEKGASPGKNI